LATRPLSTTAPSPRQPGAARPGGRLPAAAIAVAGLLTLTACQSQAGTAGAGSSPVTGGTLKFALDEGPECLNPAVSPQDVTAMVDRNVFDSLVSRSDDGSFHPWLATSWTVSPDGLTYTFNLRTGVTFQDGTAFDAAAVQTNLDYIVAKTTKSQYAASLIGTYASSTAINPTTVQIKLSKPSATFLQALSTTYLGMQSPKSIQTDAANLCNKPVGTGPFSLASFTVNGNIVLKRNAAYNWAPQTASHTGAAYLDGITFSTAADDSVRYNLLAAGQVQAIEPVPPQFAAPLKSTGLLQYLSTADPGVVQTLFFNSTKGIWADERLREALMRAVNLDALDKSVYFDEVTRSWSVLSPDTPDYDTALTDTWPTNLNTANQLLDQAGWTTRNAAGYRTKNGQELTLTWVYASAVQSTDQLPTFAQGIQAQAKAVGINVQYVAQDTGTFVTNVSTLNFGAYSTSFVRDEPDILHYFYASDETLFKGGGNVAQVAVPQLDQWLDDAETTSNPATRATDYDNAQSYIIKNALAIPLFVNMESVGASPDVHGLTFDSNAYPLFYSAWLSKS
jgi:peptide/nickel transport system substrate-binding protein